MDELNNILFDACCHDEIEVIKFIVQNNQSLIIKKDNKSNTALHIACENGIVVEGIKCLYSAYPEALTTFNDEGASPFHSVCFHGKSVENLMFLLNELPNGLDIANEKGELPIHWISEDTSEELIKYILEKCPKSAEMKNNEDGLPIHIACNKGLSMSVIRLLHKAYPAGISQQDKAGILPIHDALEFIPNLQLIKFFYKVAPASFHKADNQGNLALHYAVCSSLEVVQFVTEANKLALQTSNKHGHLPIHRACHLSVDVNVIKFLHESYPKGIKAKTSKGTLPFHLAITSFPVLNYLYELFNHAVKTPDNKGRYPIHIACQKGAPINIISFLIKKCPYAAQEKDNSHMLPIHHALINNAPLPTIKYLIELFPSALFYTDANHRLPFHLAFLYTTNLEVIHFLRTNYSKEFEELMVHFPSQKVDNSMFLLPHKIPQRESDLQNEIDRMKQTINDLKQDLEDKKKKHNEVMPTTKKELVKNDGNSLYEDEDDINSFFEDDEGERLSTQHTRTRPLTIEELPENSTEQSNSSSIYITTNIVTQEEKSTTKKNNYDNNNNKSNKKLSFEQNKRELHQQINTPKTVVSATINPNLPRPAPQLERRDKEHNNSKEFRGDSFTSKGISYYENDKNKPRSSEQLGDHYQYTYKQNTSLNKPLKNRQSPNHYHPRYHSSDSAPSETDTKMPSESDKKFPIITDQKLPAEIDCMEIDFNGDISTTACSITLRSNTIPRNLTTANNGNFAAYPSFPQTKPSVSIDTAGQTQPPATAAGRMTLLSCTDIVTDIECAVEISQPDIKIGDKFLQTLNKEMSKMREVYREEVGGTEVNITYVDHEEDIVTGIEYAVDIIQRKFQASQVHAPFISGNTIAQTFSPFTPIVPAPTSVPIIPLLPPLTRSQIQPETSIYVVDIIQRNVQASQTHAPFIGGNNIAQPFSPLTSIAPSHVATPTIVTNNVGIPASTTTRQKRKRKKRDPNEPRRNVSSFTLFSKHMCPIIKEMFQGISFIDLKRQLSLEFSELSPEDREIWNEKSKEDEKRYELAMEEYHRTGAVANQRKKRGPNLPKKPISSYRCFCNSTRKEMKQNCPEVTYYELGKLMEIEFMELTEDELNEFNELAANDKKRYDDAMVEYEAKKKKETTEMV